MKSRYLNILSKRLRNSVKMSLALNSNSIITSGKEVTNVKVKKERGGEWHALDLLKYTTTVLIVNVYYFEIQVQFL